MGRFVCSGFALQIGEQPKLIIFPQRLSPRPPRLCVSFLSKEEIAKRRGAKVAEWSGGGSFGFELGGTLWRFVLTGQGATVIDAPLHPAASVAATVHILVPYPKPKKMAKFLHFPKFVLAGFGNPA